MPAIKKKLLIEQGATFKWSFRLLQPDRVTPVDLVGCVARMQVRTEHASPTVLLDANTSNGRVTIGVPAAGWIVVTISAADTSSIAWEGGVYNFEVQFADGTVWRTHEGAISVSPEVTRA